MCPPLCLVQPFVLRWVFKLPSVLSTEDFCLPCGVQSVANIVEFPLSLLFVSVMVPLEAEVIVWIIPDTVPVIPLIGVLGRLFYLLNNREKSL